VNRTDSAALLALATFFLALALWRTNNDSRFSLLETPASCGDRKASNTLNKAPDWKTRERVGSSCVRPARNSFSSGVESKDSAGMPGSYRPWTEVR
jgi:hypothetical protein